VHESENDLSESLRRELRREPRFGALARTRVMSAVRREVAAPTRGGWLSPLVATALAASLAVGVLASPLARSGRPSGAPLEPDHASALTVAIRDTLLLVRFALIAPRAERVALVGDFNAWQPGATPLVRNAHGGAWVGQAAVARGRHRYAFVVDDTQWVADPAAPAALAPNGRPASRLVVPNLQ
jgi:hypothetical protein